MSTRPQAMAAIREYLASAQVAGDYAEFGVWQGATFREAYKALALEFPEMRFVALDTFAGLPELSGVDAVGTYHGGFYKGQFDSGTLQLFEHTLAECGADPLRVSVLPGLFQSYTALPGPVAVAWIDCDLYESARAALGLVTNYLTTGSLLVLDDWHCWRNLPEYGEQAAFADWQRLVANNRLRLHPMSADCAGPLGKAWSVERLR